jgi:hypothetical protein
LVSTGTQDSPRHEHATVSEIRLSGKRDRHRFRDLDGDGRLELIAVTQGPPPAAREIRQAVSLLLGPFVASRIQTSPERAIEIFWNRPGGYSEQARTVYRIPAEARCFLFADVLPDPGLELVLLDKSGACAAPAQASDTTIHGPGFFQRIANSQSFFDFPGDDELPEWGLVLGRGTGGDTPILPLPDGFQVWRRGAAGTDELAPAELLRFTPSVTAEASNNRAFAVTKTLPRPILRDVDGDGNLDFAMADLTGARQWILYMGRAGGRFATEPTVRPAPSLRRELKSDLLVYETADALDLNGDKVCDLIVSRTEGNIGLWDTLTTSQLIYYGRKGPAGFDATPDQVVSSVGVSIVPRAIDFDGDGNLDLLVSSYRTDLLSNAKNAIFNSARVSYFLFLMEDGRYPKNPTVERNIDMDFKLIEKGGVEPRADFSGDFDGDGVKDLLAIEQEDHVRAYRGRKRKAGLLERGGFDFDSKPMMDINLKAAADTEVIDLDGDHKYEVVFADGRTIRIVRFAP